MALEDIGVRAAIDNLGGYLGGFDDMNRAVDKHTDALDKSSKGASHWGDTLGVAAKIGAAGVGAFVGVLGFAIAEAGAAEEVQAKLGATIKSTGGIAGITAEEVTSLSDALQAVTKFGDEEITSAQTLLLTFTKVGEDVFPRATETILNMSEAMGTDLQSSTIQLGKALNDPIAGIGALARVGVQLSDQQEKQIKDFVAVGNVAAAQGVILDELETQFGGVARAAGDTLPGQMAKFQNALGNAAETIGVRLLPIITPFVASLAANIPKAIDAAIVAFDNFMTATEGVRNFLLGLLGVVQAFFEGGVQDALGDFNDLISEFQDNLQEFLSNIVAAVVARLPDWIGSLAEFGKAFVQWAIDAAPPLLTALLNVIQDVSAFIQANAGPLLDQLGQWALSFVEWVLPLIPPLIQSLGQVLSRILDFIVANAPSIADRFLSEWVPAALVWVAKVAIEIVKHLPGILFEIGKWIVTEGIPRVAQLFATLGEAIIRGIIKGIANLAGQLFSALGTLARDAFNSAMSAIGAGSPSRLFAEVGTSIGEGIVVGVISSKDKVQQALAQIFDIAQLNADIDSFVRSGNFAAAVERLMFAGASAEQAITQVQQVHQAIRAEIEATAKAADDASKRVLQAQVDYFQKNVKPFLDEAQKTAAEIARSLWNTKIKNIDAANAQGEIDPLAAFDQMRRQQIARSKSILMGRDGSGPLGGSTAGLTRIPSGAGAAASASVVYNVTANYSNPQDPQGIRLDLESVALMAGR